MPEDDRIPTFNLKAVVHETGLKPDTLRAWERRYGLPEPNRSTGGHRLYSLRDIRLLKWLIARQNEGMSISRAVDLWRRHEVEGRDPLDIPEYAEGLHTPVALAGGESLAELCESWVDACMGFDERAAEHILAQAFALYPPETVCFEVLQKGLSKIGDGWYQHKITVQQEHFASALAMRRLEALAAATPTPTRPGRVLVGCPPEESHTFTSLLITLLLRRLGRDVVYLGANVPVERLEHTAATARPDLVVMPVQQLHTAANLLDVIEALRSVRIPVAFGGSVFSRIPGLEARVPGYFLGYTTDHAPQAVERLLASPGLIQPIQPLPPGYEAALLAFREAQAHVEASTWDAMAGSGARLGDVAVANLNMGRSVVGGLRLGDVSFLSPDVHWIRGLLDNRRLPQRLIERYLRAYRDAVATHLGNQGDLLVQWLDEITAAEV